jgi:hypothetical protein
MVSFGYHCDTGSISFERAVEAMKASRASHHLIMVSNNTFFFRQGEIDTIKRYCQTVPEATFIVRLYNSNKGNWRAYPTASEYETNWRWVKQQLGAYASRVIFDDSVNEPNMAAPTSFDAGHYINRCIAMVEAASRAGIKLAVGAFAVGTLQEALLTSAYMPLWQALKKHNQAISYHGYGAIPFEAGETAPLEIVLDATKARAYMKDEKWPMSHGGWLLAEPYRIIQACAAIDYVPEIYLTECIVDNVLGHRPDVKEAWRAKYGIDMFMRDPRGIRTWEKYMKEFFASDGLDFEHGIAKLLEHARKNIYYHPAFKGACLFALNAQWDYGYEGKPNGTHKEAGSNYDRPEYTLFRHELLARVNTMTIDTPKPPETPLPPVYPDFALFPHKVRTLKQSNIRKTPDGDLLSSTAITTEWQDAKLSKENYAKSGLQWHRIEINGLTGWVAKTTNFEFAEIAAPPPPEKRFYVMVGTVQVQVSESDLDKLIAGKRLELAALEAAKLDSVLF